MQTDPVLFGGIEGGGTKFVCAVGTGPEDIRAETRFPTTTPVETLSRAISFFKQQSKEIGPLFAMGVVCFGPVDPDPTSPSFGTVLPTPKPGWSNADIVGPLHSALNLPVGFDTDVNGAALAEARWGAAQGCDPVLYITIGTGIGGGVLINGNLLHGLLHPEMGHIRIPHDVGTDPFPGVCPFHADCFEGLASGPALEKRWGQKAETLPVDHPAWDLEAHYIALALANFILTLSPQKIVVGGGVAQQTHMLSLVRKKTQTVLNGYVQSPKVNQSIADYIVLPALGGSAGVLGAIALAKQVIHSA
jgi:fructokinase